MGKTMNSEWDLPAYFITEMGTKENIDARLDGKKIVPDQKYILLPLLTSDPSLSKSLKDSPDAGFKPSGKEEKIDSEHQENKDGEVPNTEEPRINQEQDANVNNTNNINTVSSTISVAVIKNNVVDENIVYGCIDDPNMPNLEEIVYSDDDEEVGAESDMNNLATTMPMDVKSAFLYGTLEEEVYVCQHPSFVDPQFLDKVYKVEKALYGLHQASRAWYESLSTYLLENGFRRGTIDKTLFIKKDKGELTFFLGLQVKQKDDGIFISQDKYVADILKKFDFATVKTTTTPIKTNKALLKDEEAEDFDVHLYRSMIGSLMYLTASRPDIMFDVCACVRFQVTPKVSHLHAVKRIFRYLKGQPKLDLWYPRDTPFDLEAFSDSDYAGASLDRKSTTGEYVAAANCCEQTVIKEWEYRMERAATTASSLVAEQDSGNINKTQSMATLNESFPQGTDSGSGPRLVNTVRLDLMLPVQVTAVEGDFINTSIKGFNHSFASAKAKTVNEERQIQALVDKKKVIITQMSKKSDLKLNDAEGIDCLPTATIFAELERMGAKTTTWNEFSSTMTSSIIFFLYKQVEGMTRHKEVYVTPSHTKKVFANMKRPGKGFSRRVTPLFPTMMIQASEDMGEDSTAPSDSHSTPIISQPSSSKPQKKPRRKQRKDSVPTEPITDEAHISTPSCDPPQSGEDSMQLPVIHLKEKVLDLEKAKTAQAKETASLNKRVKQLEKRRKLRTSGLKRLRKVSSTSRVESSHDTQEMNDDNLMFDTCVLEEKEIEFEKVVEEPVVSVATTTKSIPVSAADPVTTAGEVVTTASASVEIPDELTLAQTLIEIKTVKLKLVTTVVTTVTSVKLRAKGIIFHDQEEQVPASTKTFFS
ncbi:putative ribonuclease H-like domain-containing protein [Tanacetum coccineum]